MKIILNKEEMIEILQKSFPKEMIPNGYMVEKIDTEGYPDKQFVIQIEKVEKEAP